MLDTVLKISIPAVTIIVGMLTGLGLLKLSPDFEIYRVVTDNEDGRVHELVRRILV